jgi:hypothetical protein
MNHAVVNLKDFGRVFALLVFLQKGIPTVQALAIEQLNPTGVVRSFGVFYGRLLG